MYITLVFVSKYTVTFVYHFTKSLRIYLPCFLSVLAVHRYFYPSKTSHFISGW